MGKGAHIYVGRGVYAHHGIDVGDGTVIHYQGKAQGGQISKNLICTFAEGRKIYEIKYEKCLSPEITVDLAHERLYEKQKNYHLFHSNCEHFAYWCKTQQNKSDQIGGIVTPLVSGSTAAVSTVLFGAGVLTPPVVIGAALTTLAIYGSSSLKKEELKEYDPNLLQKIEEYYSSKKIDYVDARNLLDDISTKNISLVDAYKKLDFLSTKKPFNSFVTICVSSYLSLFKF